MKRRKGSRRRRTEEKKERTERITGYNGNLGNLKKRRTERAAINQSHERMTMPSLMWEERRVKGQNEKPRVLG